MSGLTAVLLCGGRGERLRPFTDSVPKALVPLKGRPLVLHLMTYLAHSGVARFVVCVGYKAELVEEYLREHANPEWEVVFVDSGEAASITDRLLDARPHVSGRALMCYGDTLANVDLAALESRHSKCGALATLSVYPLHSPFGIVTFDGNDRITGFLEKPMLPHWINIGFLLCEPAAFERIEPGTDIPRFFDALVEAKELAVFRHEGKHLTINTEKDRVSAEIEMVEFYTLADE